MTACIVTGVICLLFFGFVLWTVLAIGTDEEAE